MFMMMLIPERDATSEEASMFTVKTFFAAALVGALGVGMTTAASAQPGPGGWHGGGALLDGITLTSDQQTAIHALMQAGHQQMQGLHTQLHSIHEQIDTMLLSSGTVTAAMLAPLVEQQESLMQQVDAKHVSDEIAIRNLLTTDQLAKASTTHAQLVALHDQEHALKASNGPDQPPPPQ